MLKVRSFFIEISCLKGKRQKQGKLLKIEAYCTLFFGRITKPLVMRMIRRLYIA